jgi:hypothetical protein
MGGAQFTLSGRRTGSVDIRCVEKKNILRSNFFSKSQRTHMGPFLFSCAAGRRSDGNLYTGRSVNATVVQQVFSI